MLRMSDTLCLMIHEDGGGRWIVASMPGVPSPPGPEPRRSDETLEKFTGRRTSLRAWLPRRRRHRAREAAPPDRQSVHVTPPQRDRLAARTQGLPRPEDPSAHRLALKSDAGPRTWDTSRAVPTVETQARHPHAAPTYEYAVRRAVHRGFHLGRAAARRRTYRKPLLTRTPSESR